MKAVGIVIFILIIGMHPIANANPLVDESKIKIKKALEYGWIEIVKELFRYNKLQINDEISGGRTALHLAVQYGHKTIVSFLLENGANPNNPDDEGFTPVDYADLAGKEDFVALLNTTPRSSSLLKNLPV